MASIQKRSDRYRAPNGEWRDRDSKVYRARYRDPNGRSRSVSFRTRDEARQFLKSVEGGIVRGEYVDPAAGRTMFKDWAELWWRTTARLAPSTRRGYRGLLDRQVLPYFDGRKLASIDYVTVELFIADRLNAGLSPKYVRECVSIVSGIMRCAVKASARRDNPAADHHIEVRRRKVREGDVLDMAQVQRLVEATPDRYRPAVWLLALTGMRPAELCGLRIRDVDFVRRSVSIRSTLMPVHRFGDEPYRVVEGPPKTAAGDRTVPVPGWLCDDLAAMLSSRSDGAPVDRNGYLFQTRYGNAVNRDHFREKVVRPALRRAGLPETIRTYDLRHAHASMLIDVGANPLELAARMGHTDPSVSLRVYGHLYEGTQRRLTDQLDELRRATGAAGPSDAPVVPIRGTQET
jgi:integrase